MTKIQKYKKKNGSTAYMFQVYLGINPKNGKELRTTKRGFKTLQEAKLALARIQVASKNPDFILDSKKTFEEISEMWLEQYKNTVKASTFTVQKMALKKHILPLFGKIQIGKITIPYCQKQVNHWFTYYKKYSNLISITASIFQYAINIRLLTTNPMDGIIRPKKQQSIDEEEFQAPYYNKEQLHEFLSIAKTTTQEPLYLMFRILAYTGLRKGELHALRWKDIDIAHQALSVRQTLATVGTDDSWELVFQPPKTRKSIRTLSLDTETLRLIKQWRIRQKEHFFKVGIKIEDDSQLLFASIENKPLYLDFLNHNLKKIIEGHQLEKMTVHGFRHTHCSLLFESGATIKEVQERMGHTDIKTTMNIYAHVTDRQREETADKFASFMGG